MAQINYLQMQKNTEAYIAGKVIFDAGDAGSIMYYVREGEVSLFYNDTLLETVGPGGIFGEMVLIDEPTRSAAAIATTDCVVVPVDRDLFMYLVQETPTFGIQVMRIMAQRLRTMNEHLC